MFQTKYIFLSIIITFCGCSNKEDNIIKISHSYFESHILRDVNFVRGFLDYEGESTVDMTNFITLTDYFGKTDLRNKKILPSMILLLSPQFLPTYYPDEKQFYANAEPWYYRDSLNHKLAAINPIPNQNINDQRDKYFLIYRRPVGNSKTELTELIVTNYCLTDSIIIMFYLNKKSGKIVNYTIHSLSGRELKSLHEFFITQNRSIDANYCEEILSSQNYQYFDFEELDSLLSN